MRMAARRTSAGTASAQSPGRFAVTSMVAFGLVLVLACVQWIRTDASGSDAFAQVPVRVTVRRYSFGDGRQKLENALMGSGINEYHFELEPDGGVYADYGRALDRSHPDDIRTLGDELVIRENSDADTSDWNLFLRVPEHADVSNPVGRWAVYLRQYDGAWTKTDWALLYADGTGVCGRRSDPINVGDRTLAQRGTACSWHTVQAADGSLVVIDYEGGQYVVIVTFDR